MACASGRLRLATIDRNDAKRRLTWDAVEDRELPETNADEPHEDCELCGTRKL